MISNLEILYAFHGLVKSKHDAKLVCYWISSVNAKNHTNASYFVLPCQAFTDNFVDTTCRWEFLSSSESETRNKYALPLDRDILLTAKRVSIPGSRRAQGGDVVRTIEEYAIGQLNNICLRGVRRAVDTALIVPRLGSTLRGA
jgi:hypothetical protein